jgi:Na+/H+ antiporter NhaD/arsenite permease-like protein
VPIWSVTPFVLLLLCIAVLPLVAEHFWHKNRNKAIVAAALALPVAGYLLWLGPATQWHSTQALLGEVAEYGSFLALLGSLYIVAGGLTLEGDLPASPAANTLLLAFGAVLANLIGTTGASMALIRPLLQANRTRTHRGHLPVFFIFTVSNVGGLLTPLGDPPLFLGFLYGVDFFWTFRLWRHWLLVNGLVLLVFWVLDSRARRHESPPAIASDTRQPLRLRGTLNLVWLAGIIAAVLFQSKQAGDPAGVWLSQFFPCPSLTLTQPWGEMLMIAMALFSLWLTPRGARRLNGFTWGPIAEVAILFAGIFVAMVPALDLLQGRGPEWGLNALAPWQYFWATGLLSSLLDNAPTYLAFATMAASPHDIAWLATNRPQVLEAISCGAVFMGANSYVGNGPNFMVKAMAEDAGYRPPSFLGYMVYAALVLGPIFLLVTFLFFR